MKKIDMMFNNDTIIDIHVYDSGKDGYTPQKGVDYFTERDIDRLLEKIQVEALDIEFATEEEVLKILE